MTLTDGVQVREGAIGDVPGRLLAGLLGAEQAGDELPPMWHIVHLLEPWTRSQLGPDGHALRGLPTPPTDPHRRLFAGGRALHTRLLRLHEPASRTSRVTSSTVKQGREGPLTFVTVRHVYEQGGQVAVVDEHDIVYQPVPSAAGRAAVEPEGPPEEIDEVATLAVDPVALFCFSALTANAHRIHYDADFARGEGHPDLVVHGPLQVLLMAESLRRRGVDVLGREFGYRLLAPVRGPQLLRAGVPRTSGPDVVVLDGTGRRVARGALR